MLTDQLRCLVVVVVIDLWLLVVAMGEQTKRWLGQVVFVASKTTEDEDDDEEEDEDNWRIESDFK